MAAPTTGIISNYNAAVNDQSLTTWDANWSRLFGYSFDFLGSTSPAGSIKGGHATSLSADYYDTTSFGPNSEIYLTVPTLPTSGKTIRLMVRMQNPATAETGYRLVYTHGAPGTGHIQREDAGVNTTLVGPVALTLAATDGLWFRAYGNILTGYKYTASAWGAVSGLTYDITPDATKYTTAGYLAIATNDNVGRYDNVGGGTAYTYSFPTVSGGMEICAQSLSELTPGSYFGTVSGIPEDEIDRVGSVLVPSISKLSGVLIR